jgi:predicted patatin/cPLA2 family phospholipase
MRRRRENGYMPGRDSDGARLALIVEGGAMRGAISSGTLDALYQLGFSNCFDEVWGNSAGALNASYFVSGQITLGTTIYYENAIDPNFINLWNWPDPLNVEWLIENWIGNGKTLDVSAVMRSGTDLYIAATNAETGKVRFFSNREGRPDIIIPALEASCSVPLFVTKKVIIDGVRYNDGLVEAAIPIKYPAQNCTHVVAALTREHGYRKVNKKLLKWGDNLVLRGYNAQYREQYQRKYLSYNSALDQLVSGKQPLYSLVIAPSEGDFILRNHENRSVPLKKAVDQAMRRVECIFGVPSGMVKHYAELHSEHLK